MPTSRERVLLILAALVIAAVTALHASLVLLINSPDNAITRALHPIIRFYDGPQLDQGWSLFAPNPLSKNEHVLVRGRTAEGAITAWYDVSQYFLVEMDRNRFTSTRAVAEALLHAAMMLKSEKPKQRAIARVEVARTAAMVLQLYSAEKHLVALEIDVDWKPIRSINGVRSRASAHAIAGARFGWVPMPTVSRL